MGNIVTELAEAGLRGVDDFAELLARRADEIRAGAAGAAPDVAINVARLQDNMLDGMVTQSGLTSQEILDATTRALRAAPDAADSAALAAQVRSGNPFADALIADAVTQGDEGVQALIESTLRVSGPTSPSAGRIVAGAADEAAPTPAAGVADDAAPVSGGVTDDVLETATRPSFWDHGIGGFLNRIVTRPGQSPLRNEDGSVVLSRNPLWRGGGHSPVMHADPTAPREIATGRLVIGGLATAATALTLYGAEPEEGILSIDDGTPGIGQSIGNMFESLAHRVSVWAEGNENRNVGLTSEGGQVGTSPEILGAIETKFTDVLAPRIAGQFNEGGYLLDDAEMTDVIACMGDHFYMVAEDVGATLNYDQSYEIFIGAFSRAVENEGMALEGCGLDPDHSERAIDFANQEFSVGLQP